MWCVPVVALKRTLGLLAEAGADAPRREARNILLNYSRRVENENVSARRAVAAGLNEMTPIIESLWPNQLPEDLSRGTMKALEKETIPETAALLAAFLESDLGVRQPASASMFANAVKFLRDNDIQATKDNVSVNNLRHALGNLPFNRPPDDTEKESLKVRSVCVTMPPAATIASRCLARRARM